MPSRHQLIVFLFHGFDFFLVFFLHLHNVYLFKMPPGGWAGPCSKVGLFRSSLADWVFNKPSQRWPPSSMITWGGISDHWWHDGLIQDVENNCPGISLYLRYAKSSCYISSIRFLCNTYFRLITQSQSIFPQFVSNQFSFRQKPWRRGRWWKRGGEVGTSLGKRWDQSLNWDKFRNFIGMYEW